MRIAMPNRGHVDGLLTVVAGRWGAAFERRPAVHVYGRLSWAGWERLYGQVFAYQRATSDPAPGSSDVLHPPPRALTRLTLAIRRRTARSTAARSLARAAFSAVMTSR